MRLSHLNESDHTNPPKRIVTAHGTSLWVLKAVESNGWTLVLVKREGAPRYKESHYYSIFAFEWEEGIGGRMVPQWNAPIILDTLFNHAEAEDALNRRLSKCESIGYPGPFFVANTSASNGMRAEW